MECGALKGVEGQTERPRGRPRRLTDEQEKEIRRLRDTRGLGAKKIAALLERLADKPLPALRLSLAKAISTGDWAFARCVGGGGRVICPGETSARLAGVAFLKNGESEKRLVSTLGSDENPESL